MASPTCTTAYYRKHGRGAESDDLAGLVVSLASSTSDSPTGVVILIDAFSVQI